MVEHERLESCVGRCQHGERVSSFHWEGSLTDYLDLVKKNPGVARNAFQRMYDMILGWGTTSYVEYKKNIVRYKFFDDPINHGQDASSASTCR